MLSNNIDELLERVSKEMPDLATAISSERTNPDKVAELMRLTSFSVEERDLISGRKVPIFPDSLRGQRKFYQKIVAELSEQGFARLNQSLDKYATKKKKSAQTEKKPVFDDRQYPGWGDW